VGVGTFERALDPLAALKKALTNLSWRRELCPKRSRGWWPKGGYIGGRDDQVGDSIWELSR
jgi:hypothetical protein